MPVDQYNSTKVLVSGQHIRFKRMLKCRSEILIHLYLPIFTPDDTAIIIRDEVVGRIFASFQKRHITTVTLAAPLRVSVH